MMNGWLELILVSQKRQTFSNIFERIMNFQSRNADGVKLYIQMKDKALKVQEDFKKKTKVQKQSEYKWNWIEINYCKIENK